MPAGCSPTGYFCVQLIALVSLAKIAGTHAMLKNQLPEEPIAVLQHVATLEVRTVETLDPASSLRSCGEMRGGKRRSCGETGIKTAGVGCRAFVPRL